MRGYPGFIWKLRETDRYFYCAHCLIAYYGETKMALSAERKEEIIKDYALSDGDTGSPEV